jgi:hypothetical protein
VQIDFVYDSSVNNAPSGFTTALNAAATFLDSLIINPITVTIKVGWQEDDGLPLTGNTIGEGGPIGGTYLDYSQLRSDLAGNATSAADATALANLPTTDPTHGGRFFVSSAQEKALGLLAPNAPGTDGSVGFGGSFAFNFNPNDRAIPGELDFVGVAEHELTHALGRTSDVGTGAYTPLDLFRYAAPGVRQLSTGPAYFSIDGGQTNLNPYDTVSDPADWASSVSDDSFNSFSNSGVANVMTQTDITEMNVIGFTTEGSPLPFGLSGTGASLASDDEVPVFPFAGVTIRDQNPNTSETVTINVISPANGTLANLGGGSYNAATGVYTISGAPTAVNAAIDGLHFTPTFQQASAGNTVVTHFVIRVGNTLGQTASDSTANLTVTPVGNFPTLATVTGGNNGFVVSYGMDTRANATTLQALFNNISPGVNAGTIITGTPGATPAIPGGKSGLVQVFSPALVVLPTDYNTALVETSQATVVGGNGNGQLVAANQGGMVFSAGTGAGSVIGTGGNNFAYVGSAGGSQYIALGNGIDTINIAGGNNTISGGNGANLIYLGAGQNRVMTSGKDTISTGTGNATVSVNGAGSLIFGNLTNQPGNLNAALGGARATIAAANGAASITTTGANALVFGSYGVTTGGLSELDTGLSTTIAAGNFGAAVTLDGANALLFGNFTNTPGAVTLNDGGLADTISAGNSALNAYMQGQQAVLFGGYSATPGALNVVDAGSADTIVAGNSNTNVTGGPGGGRLVVFGGAGALNFVGGAGSATVVAGAGASSVTGGSGGNELVGGSGADVILGGRGNDTLVAGAGPETLAGGGGADVYSFVSNLTHGSVDTILDFNANDTLYLTGYGADDAATALDNAASSNGSTTITLTDHTQITFAGVANTSVLQGHVFSF